MNIFKFSLQIKTESDQDNFNKAFDDILKLSKLLIAYAPTFIEHPIPDQEPWLSINGDEITLEIDGFVHLTANDAKNFGKIEYDFGKRSPTDDAFIIAIMCLFGHYLKFIDIGDEMYLYDLPDAILLANLVNSEVHIEKIPWLDEEVRTSMEKPTESMIELCQEIQGNIQ